MDIQIGRMYHLKISANHDYEVLILVTKAWTQIWPPTDSPINANSATVDFKLLASTIKIGWSMIYVSLFNRSSPIEIDPKDLPLFLTWPAHTPDFEEALKDV
jgi:hypothetical protein